MRRAALVLGVFVAGAASLLAAALYGAAKAAELDWKARGGA